MIRDPLFRGSFWGRGKGGEIPRTGMFLNQGPCFSSGGWEEKILEPPNRPTAQQPSQTHKSSQSKERERERERERQSGKIFSYQFISSIASLSQRNNNKTSTKI